MHFYGRTRKDVADKLRDGQSRLAHGDTPREESVRLDTFLDRWLEDVIKPSKRHSTHRSYEIIVEKHLKPSRLGGMKLRDLNEAQIQHVFVTKNKTPTRTQALTLIVLRRALDRAQQWRMIDRNPAKHVALPRQERPERHPLTRQEVHRLLEVAKSDRLFALYYLAIDTGMRQGELLALRWSDIVDGTIRIQRSLDQHSGSFTAPKTAAARRPVALSRETQRVLLEHRERQAASGCSGPLVFTNADGGPLRPSNYQRRSFKPLLKKAGIDQSVRFHDLRHTAATLLLGAGIHPKIVSERLGHATIAITMDTYQHVSTTMQSGAARVMEDILAGVKGA